jgi:hypothetical protein
MNNKYNIGDVVEMNSMWDKRYGIIIHIDDRSKEYPPVYRILIQGHTNPAWLDDKAVLRKID